MTSTALHTHRRPAPKPAHLHTAPSRRTAAAQPVAAQAAGPAWPPYLQRRCACTGCGPCASGADTDVLQLRADGAATATAAPALSLGAGRPLPSTVRQQVEPLFGQSFAHVRLHDGPAAARATRAVGAVAFTSGAHIAFGPGRYAPHTPGGLHLLSHELAHTVQQRGLGTAAPLQRAALTIGAAHSPHETEADHAADRVLQGQRVGALTPVRAPVLQRYASTTAAAGPAPSSQTPAASEGWGTALWRGVRRGLDRAGAVATRAVQAGVTAAAGLVRSGAGWVGGLAARVGQALQSAGALMARGAALVEGVVHRALHATLAPLLHLLQLGRWWQMLNQGLRLGAQALAQAALRWLGGHCAGLYQAAQTFGHWLGEQVQALIAEVSAQWRLWGARLHRMWALVRGQLAVMLNGVMAQVALLADTLWQALAPVRALVGAVITQVGELAWQAAAGAWGWLSDQSSRLLQVLREMATSAVEWAVAQAQPLMRSIEVMAQNLLNGLPPQVANPLRQWARATAQRWRRLWRALREGGPAGLLLQAVADLQADLMLIGALCNILGVWLSNQLQSLVDWFQANLRALMATPLGRLMLAASAVALAGALAAGALLVVMANQVLGAWQAFQAWIEPFVAAVVLKLQLWRAWARAAVAMAARRLTEWWSDSVWLPLLRLIAWARETPCLRELLIVSGFNALLTTLTRLRAGVAQLVALIRNPAPLLAALRRGLGERVARVLPLISSMLGTWVFPAHPVHRAEVARHLAPAVEDMAANWWSHLLEMGSSLLWPWPTVGQSLPEFGRRGLGCVVALLRLDVSTAVDEGLATLQQLNTMAGALWGWYFIGSVVVGGVVGALGAAPTLGASIWAGMGTGAGHAATVGLGLLVAMVVTERLVIHKGVTDALVLNPRIADTVKRAQANDAAYARIAHSTFTLAVLAALMILGELASRLASAIWRNVRTVLGLSERPVAQGGGRRTVPADISPADIASARRSLGEVIDQPGRARPPRDSALRNRYDLEVELEGGWRWRRERDTGFWCLSINPVRCGIALDEGLSARAARALERDRAAQSAEAVRERIDVHRAGLMAAQDEIALIDSAMSRLRAAHRSGGRPAFEVLSAAERELLNGLHPSGDIGGLNLGEISRLADVELVALRRELLVGDASEASMLREMRRVGMSHQEFLRRASPNGPARLRRLSLEGGNDAATLSRPRSGLLDVDHVVALTEVMDMPGFRRLSPEQQLEILNNPEFLRAIDRSANRSRGNRSWESWPQASEFYDATALARMRQLEASLRVRIQDRINSLLH